MLLYGITSRFQSDPSTRFCIGVRSSEVQLCREEALEGGFAIPANIFSGVPLHALVICEHQGEVELCGRVPFVGTFRYHILAVMVSAFP